jgi:hypothetical protein
MNYMSGEVMVMAVRLTTIFPTLRSNMNLTTGISIMREIEVEVIHLQYSLLHNHQRIPNLEMTVSNKTNDASDNSVIQRTQSTQKPVLGTTPQPVYKGNSISKLQIQVATYVFELSAGNCHR